MGLGEGSNNMKTIVIRNTYGKEIFSHTCENNTIKKTVLEADLSGANLSRADFNENTSMFLPQCPDGAFIGWKKAKDKIVKIEICEDSKRSSATSLKCRCSKAIVLEIQEYDGTHSTVNEVASDYKEDFIYKIGEVVEVSDFNENRWYECSSGIHFFISREMAVKYC